MKRHSIIVLSAVLVLLSCAVQAQDLQMAKPEEVGLSTERLARITKTMQQHVDNKELAGVVMLLARKGKVAYYETLGMRDVEEGKAMEEDTLFRIYSMTKPITSAAVMMLYEEGLFQLNDPVSKFIPALGGLDVLVEDTDGDTGEVTYRLDPSEQDMTVQDLLRHTSGLHYGWGSGKIDEMLKKAGTRSEGTDLEGMVNKLATAPLKHQPGTRWEYSVSTDVLGRLVEVLSGMPFDQFLEERIFVPLGMLDTAFYLSSDKLDRLAATYVADDDKKLTVRPSRRSADTKPSQPSGGGGLLSSTTDYFTFCQMMLNGGELNGVRLLSRKTVELMSRDHLGDIPGMGDGSGFGLGFAVSLNPALKSTIDSEGSYAWGGAAHTSFWIDPKEEFIGVFMVHIFNPQMSYQEQFRILSYQSIAD
jgi:CubicO group peptidase (beta-lactamase class C family)